MIVVILLLLIFSYFGLIIHGDPPVHYFVTVAPLITIAIAYIVGKLKIKPLLFLILVIIINTPFYFSNKFLYKKGNYLKKIAIAKEIIDNADGRKFNLKRVGNFDYYADNYAQNYIYLMWLLGNEPVKDEQPLKYTIYEQNNDIYFE